VRAIVPILEHIGPVLDRTFDQVGSFISKHGATPAEPSLTVYYVEGHCERALK